MFEEKLNALYEQFGYQKFRMSHFEEYDLYAQNRPFLGGGHLITFSDIDGSLKALKPDITISIIKNNDGKSEKVYYNENVYREVNGSYQEMLQVGVESVGNPDIYAQAEVIALALQSLKVFSPEYILDISDIGFLGSVLEEMELSSSVQEEIFRCFSQKNMPEIDLFVKKGILKASDREILKRLMEIYGPLEEGIAQVEALPLKQKARKELENLKMLAKVLTAFGTEAGICLDFSLVNSMDYYNGVIFQGFLKGVPYPVLSGGRYDNLPKRMGKPATGAIGFAITMELITQYLEQRKFFDADIRMRYEDSCDFARMTELVTTLRAGGKQVLCEHVGTESSMRCLKQIVYRNGMRAEEVMQ